VVFLLPYAYQIIIIERHGTDSFEHVSCFTIMFKNIKTGSSQTPLGSLEPERCPGWLWFASVRTSSFGPSCLATGGANYILWNQGPSPSESCYATDRERWYVCRWCTHKSTLCSLAVDRHITLNAVVAVSDAVSVIALSPCGEGEHALALHSRRCTVLQRQWLFSAV